MGSVPLSSQGEVLKGIKKMGANHFKPYLFVVVLGLDSITVVTAVKYMSLTQDFLLKKKTVLNRVHIRRFRKMLAFL